MNRLNLRRVAAVAAGALIGLAGVATVASPASAHYSNVTGSAVCDTTTGQWQVTWTVKSVMHMAAKSFRLESVALTPKGTLISGIAATKEKNKYPHDVNTPLTGVQVVPGSATEATLTVQMKWNDTYTEKPNQGKVTFKGKCKENPKGSPSPEPETPSSPEPETPSSPEPETPSSPEPETPSSPEPETPSSPEPETPGNPEPNAPVTAPTASFSSDCDGKVTVTLANGADATADVKLTVQAKGFNETYTIKPDDSRNDIVVPAGAGKITVTEGDKQLGEPYTWESPENCVLPGEPQAGYESTCDKLVFGFANPEDGKAFEVTLTPNKGEAQTRTVEPGQTVFVEFEAFEGLTVTPSAEGLDDTSPIAWEKPADCDGQGGGLPVTGAAIGGIVGGAAVLLGAGAVLFVMARRRRVRFTA
ncbi:cell wall anchor protein [Micromonospora sp. NPDC006766]|uniref:cell wall anchor protein n=1 Tax=Micromonospora sp. NPDC006766 TaxID=3154778 RepID=UPI0033F73338